MASSSSSAPPPPSSNVISTIPSLQTFLSSLRKGHQTLCLDLEGQNLGRNGTLTLISIHLLPDQETHIIDVQTLGTAAFTTTDGTTTLKSILEDERYPKYIWDVRNDADALKSHHDVGLAGVTDIQLLENATRRTDKTYLRGLAICVEKDLDLSPRE